MRRHDERHDANGGAELFAERDRALVAMVAVGDEELASRGRQPPAARPPQARAVHLQHRRLVRNRKRQLDVGEQEDRLGLDAGLAKQPAPFVPDGRTRALVRQHRARLVRLRRDRGDHTVTLARDAVRPTNSSTASQTAGSSSSTRIPRGATRGRASGLVYRLGERHVEDVVRTAREERRPLLVVDRVVRRSDQVGQRAGRAGVADGAKRLDVAHRGERTNGLRPIVET